MAEELLAQLVDAPSSDAFLIYADALQEAGDPHGELIALAVRAEQAGTPPTERQLALTTELTAELLGAVEHISFRWKSGFVDEIVLPAGAINAGVKTRLFSHRALALARTVRISADRSSRSRNASIERLIATPLRHTLTTLEFASTLRPVTEVLSDVLDECPRLTDLTWPAHSIDVAVLAAHPRLERLAIYGETSDANLDAVFAGPWPLTGLVVKPAHATTVTPPIAEILDGRRFPALTELGLLQCGFENDFLRQLRGSKLASRLRVLALAWNRVDEDVVKPLKSTLANVRLDYALPSTERETTPVAYWIARHLSANLDREREAIPHAELATRSKPTDYYAWTELARAHLVLEHDPEALAAYEHAIACDPKSWWAHARHADLLSYAGRFDEAEAELRSMLALEPARVADTHARLGKLYLRCDRIEEMDDAYERAIEVAAAADRPQFVTAYIESLLDAQLLPAARMILERYRSEDDTLRRIDATLALAEGNPARALELVVIRPKRFEGEARFAWFLGEAAALRALDRPDEARTLYARIVADADCPDWIAAAWLGLTLLGDDPFASITGLSSFEINDQIAAAVRTPDHDVHDSTARPNDRVPATLAAIGADVVRGRLERARARVLALEAEFAAGARPRSVFAHSAELLRAADHPLVHQAIAITTP
ncbi:MAG: hypothetical protein QM831_33465 [Kofleriaceae bacterium]